ncbi:hypothetical protein HHK36_023177 [Tetracentron sinense]|uniref:RRM domain-containing protein n=1 Tax=Tetracentron sinense TaxID=13715 RepID=A0A834YQT5_TETSI|nr:hypothetical protein HHK36_023177 [Tetracentron sinense]
MMGAVSFASSATPPAIRISLLGSSKIGSSKSLNLRASLFDFPLASRIIVKNLSYSINESSLQKEFSNFGPIAEVKLLKDEATKRSKGYAFVQYTSQDDAMLALENMDHKSLDGRVIYVELAKPMSNVFGAYPRTSGPPTEQNTVKQRRHRRC